MSKKINAEVSLNIIESRKPELDAKLVADGIAQQLERRGFLEELQKGCAKCNWLGLKELELIAQADSAVQRLLELNGTEKEEFHYIH